MSQQTPDSFDLEAFHQQAVETPSHEDVTAMRELLYTTLDAAGVDPTIDEAGNVLATRGADDGTHIVLNTHLDTVPPHVPYSSESTPPGIEGSKSDGDVVCGRGSCDAKGPLAVFVDAFLSVAPTDGKLTLAITPDEETTQTGAAHLTETLAADGYIVGEPTNLDVCTGARGQFDGTVEISGVAAHASNPADGVNAVRAAGWVMDAMETFDETAGMDTHETLGSPTLTPTKIDGGVAFNQIPDRCQIGFDRRSVPPEDPATFPSKLEAHLKAHVPADVGISVSLTQRDAPHLQAFATDRTEPLVRELAAVSSGTVRPFGAATEASYFAAVAPTVVFGPGVLADEVGGVAHAEREYVHVDALHEASRAVIQTTSALV